MSDSAGGDRSWDSSRRRAHGGGMADVLTESGFVSDDDDVMRAPMALRVAMRQSSSTSSLPTRSTIPTIKKKPPHTYNATSMNYSPYIPNSADLAFAAANEGAKSPSPKRRSAAAAAVIDPNAEAKARAAAERRQRLLAQMATSGATQPSVYMAQIMHEIESLDVASPGGVHPIGPLGGDAPGAQPDLARLRALQTQLESYDNTHASQPAAASSRPTSASIRRPTPAPADALIDAASQSPPLNLEALSHYLTPAQAAQLHLYPQLLVQAVHAAQEHQARLLSGAYDLPPPILTPPPEPEPAFRAPLKRDVAPASVAPTTTFLHRTQSGQGWNDNVVSPFSSPVQSNGRPRAKKDIGTFGAPPALIFPGAPGYVRQKSPWKKAASVAPGGNQLPPVGNAATNRMDQSTHNTNRMPHPFTDEKSSSHSTGLLTSPPTLRNVSSSGTLLSPLRNPHFGTPLPSSATAAHTPATPHQLQPTSALRTVTQIMPSPTSDANGSNTIPPTSSSSGSLLGSSSSSNFHNVHSDLAQSLFDLTHHFDHHQQRQQMESIAGMASVALAAIAGESITNELSSQHQPSYWDMNPSIESVLGKYLVYFSGARDKYHLTQPTYDSLSVSHGQQPHPLEEPSSSSSSSNKIELHTSNSKMAWEDAGIAEKDILLPSTKEMTHHIETQLVQQTLFEHGWFSSGFATNNVEEDSSKGIIEGEVARTNDETLVLRGEDTPAAPTRTIVDRKKEEEKFLSPLVAPSHEPTSPPSLASSLIRSPVSSLNLRGLIPRTTLPADGGRFAPTLTNQNVQDRRLITPAKGLHQTQTQTTTNSIQQRTTTNAIDYDLAALDQAQPDTRPQRDAGITVHGRSTSSAVEDSTHATVTNGPTQSIFLPVVANASIIPPPLYSNLPSIDMAEILAMRDIEAARLDALIPPVPSRSILDFIDTHARASEAATREAILLTNMVEDGILQPNEVEQRMKEIMQKLKHDKIEANRNIVQATTTTTTTHQQQSPDSNHVPLPPPSTAPPLPTTSILLQPHDDAFSPKSNPIIFQLPTSNSTTQQHDDKDEEDDDYDDDEEDDNNKTVEQQTTQASKETVSTSLEQTTATNDEELKADALEPTPLADEPAAAGVNESAADAAADSSDPYADDFESDPAPAESPAAAGSSDDVAAPDSSAVSSAATSDADADASTAHAAEQHAAIRIQSVFRGHQVRKHNQPTMETNEEDVNDEDEEILEEAPPTTM